MELDYVKLKDIKPALAGYISESQKLLNRSVVPDEEAVHDIRVLMKKARATARLLSSQVDDELFIKENVTYREIGRMMASSRETSVQRRTLKLLKKENKDLFIRLSENEQINDLLNKAAFRLRFYTLDKLDPQLLLKELEKTYVITADNYLKCRINPKPAALHQFRKRSKDFLYQLYFFRPLNPITIKDLEKKLDILTQNLGKYNDLTQIIRLLDYKPASPENPTPIDELIVVIRDK